MTLKRSILSLAMAASFVASSALAAVSDTDSDGLWREIPHSTPGEPACPDAVVDLLDFNEVAAHAQGVWEGLEGPVLAPLPESTVRLFPLDSMTARNADELLVESNVEVITIDGKDGAIISDAMTFGGPSPFSSKTVKGAPYSAEVLQEKVQTLADGNQIRRGTQQRVFRDSEGRTRREFLRGDRIVSVMITDPVAKKQYSLSPDAKRAVEMGFFEFAFDFETLQKEAKALADKVRSSERGGAMLEESRAAMARLRDSLMQRTRDTNRGQVGTDVRVIKIESGKDDEISVHTGTPGATVISKSRITLNEDALSGAIANGFSGLAGKKAEVTPLGSKMLEGVRAEGVTRSYTIPAGEIGNQMPIVVSSESWKSPELGITVYSRYRDPRSGENTLSVKNIQRTEPSADLFKVPSDYKLIEPAKHVVRSKGLG